MAAGNSRVEELRRRVREDPASIAFAQLAEEVRRRGNYHEAVRVCRTGLTHRPSYLSARVTLGRALMALGDHAAARAEFEHVLRTAPDNLVALRSLEEMHQRRRNVIPDDREVLAQLEAWLAAILADRVEREGCSGGSARGCLAATSRNPPY